MLIPWKCGRLAALAVASASIGLQPANLGLTCGIW